MYLKSKKILAFILFCATFLGNGQSKITGKIIDSDTGAPLKFTQIKNIDTNTSISSNPDGSFEILKEGHYTFLKEGYIIKTIKLTENQYYIIQLNINPSELNEVIINANHIPKKLKKATASIAIITSKDIALSNNTDFAPILNRTPGVFMQNGALNTNRITIRGIGSRNLFGTAKIRAYFKDIPLTNGSGETTIEDFELASISRFEIIKGAGSSIYGAGLGGTIHLTPQNAYLNNSNINGELSIGSFGLRKGIVNINHGTTKNSFRAVYSNTHSDGYRENNAYNRQTFTMNSSHYISKKNEITFLASYVDLKAFIPSSINETDYLNNPEKAAFTWQQSKGFEDSKRGVFGLSWNHNYHSKLKQVTSIFTSFRDAYEPRPFNILEENTFAFGIRTRLLGNYKLFNKNLNWTLGGELFKDLYTYGTFENLYEDFPTGNGSVKGNRLSNFKEKRNYYNVFIETNYEFSENTTLSLGFNLNKTAYKLDDRFTVSVENPDQSGSFKFKNIVSPKLGISHLFSKNISLFSSISHGFSPISLNETLLPDGQINTDLKPETGWNFEIGTRASLLNNKLQLNLAVYRLNIKNLLVSRRTAQDEFIGINAGKTQHDGLEISLNYDWLKKEELSISTFANYTLNNFTFKEFIDNTNDFSGNELTGVPSDVFNTGILIDSAFGFYGNINFQYVGSMPITDANSLYSDSYNLTNLKIGFKVYLNKKLKLNAFLGLNNIFDEHYASQILINTSGFGGSAPRYYYPGNPVNYYTGININYVF
ncbi:TonB-dependent receptor [Flavivirga aquimarina]|uniref:TonB-dependent receptor n=1 Tax=Flavivirga aquimarina TaxID=2027862 RepID=A0ABT8WEX4_9FLAO|nr:TonB-dependent receptor [Flavivirga aquimarina]MDO5971704.1 TonB-dependent receptor [Flavivirga aquimarina]